jgi:iron complex outermembrane receptor protein
MRIGLSCLLIASMLLFAIPACASKKIDNNDNDLTSRSLGELMELEIGTVHGASGYEQKVTRAPASVSIVTAEDIQRRGYRTLADILAGVGNFYISYDRNYHYVGSRGFLRPGDYNTRYLLIVDGHRLNDSIYNQAAIGTDFPIDIDLIERVEVIRGPSSSLYGTNAFMGVINVLTRKGRQIGGTEISGAAGSHNTYQGRVTFGNRFEGANSEVLVSGTKYRSSGNEELYYPEFNDPSTNYGIVRGCDGDSFGNAFLNAGWGYLNLQGVYGSRSKDIPTAPWGTAFGEAGTKSVDDRGYADLSFDRTFGSLALLARLYYDRYRYDGEYYFPTYLNKDRATGESWGGEMKLTKTLFEKHKLTAGTEYMDNFRQDQSTWNENPRVEYFNDQRSCSQWAAYLQDEIALLPTLLLNIGVRYDHYETFGGTTNPRLALIYSPRETTHIKLIYGEAFRAPSVYELYYNDGNVSSKANPDLQPEKISTSEIVLEQYLPQGIKMSASLFHNRIKDLIVQRIDPADGLMVFQNLDEVQTNGIGLELEKRWGNGIRGQLAYTYQESKNETDGSALAWSPRHLAKAHLQVPFFNERLVFALEEFYVDHVLTISGTDAASYFLTNLTVLGKEWLPGLESSLSIYNAFNRNVEYAAGSEHMQRTIEGDGRTMRIKFTYRF